MSQSHITMPITGPSLIALHNFENGHDKWYSLRIDFIANNRYNIVASWGPHGKMIGEQPKGQFDTWIEAANHTELLALKKSRNGYSDIRSEYYRANHFTIEQSDILQWIPNNLISYGPHVALPPVSELATPVAPSGVSGKYITDHHKPHPSAITTTQPKKKQKAKPQPEPKRIRDIQF